MLKGSPFVFLLKLCDQYGLPPALLQFFLYLFVGGLCSICDVGGFWLLQAADIPIIIASATSFTVATTLNYFLSYFFVFERGRFSMSHEIARVFVVSLIGLALNTLLVYLFVSDLALNGVLAKIIAIPLVLFWNFLGRRIFVFRPTIPVLCK